MPTDRCKAEQPVESDTLRFPIDAVNLIRAMQAGEPAPTQFAMSDTANRALRSFERVSRRIDDLARQLNCLGFFDDDDDQPRAA